jgi:arylsulfatase A-like enzyme
MIFMGAGVEPGTSDSPVYTVDFAPTLAGLAGIPVPDDLDSRSIYPNTVRLPRDWLAPDAEALWPGRNRLHQP